MVKHIFCCYLILVTLLTFAKLTIIKPTTCAAVAKIYQISQNGYFTLYDSTYKPYLAFCDFQSDPGFAWTLIESLSLPNVRIATYRKSFYYSVPANECSPNWSRYRLSKAKMMMIKNSAFSTHFRATCNFNAEDEKGIRNHNDYLRASFCAYDYLLVAKNVWTCATVDYINVHGYICSKCSIPLYSSNSYHLFTYLPYAKSMCGPLPFPEMVAVEDLFGYYHNIKPQFSCTANNTSTTNWWIGGSIL